MLSFNRNKINQTGLYCLRAPIIMPYVFAVIISLFSVDCYASEETNSSARSDINKTISYAIKLLEDKHAKEFIDEFIYPKNLQSMLQKNTHNKITQNFLKKKNGSLSKAEKLLLKLKYIQARYPNIDNSKLSDTARFAYDQPIGSVQIIILFRENGKWWFVN